MRYPRRGFTLVELLGVLAIMAILAGAASITLNGARRRADLQGAVEQIQFVDASVRTLARNSDRPVDLLLSLESGRLSRSIDGVSTTLCVLPGEVKIARVRVGRTPVDFGSQTISVTAGGITPSYAVRLDGASGDHQWLFFPGPSGQMIKVNDEDLEAVVQLSTSPVGPDAR